MVGDETVRYLDDVLAELRSARKAFPPFASAHEGYAILFEEVDELWEAIRLKQSNPHRNKRVREEAIQVAAMSLRLLGDICDKA